MRGIIFLALSFLSLAIIISGCKKEDKEYLYVSPSSIEFNYNDDEISITVSNIGSEEFTWTVTGNLTLMEFSKTSGTASKNAPDEFQIILKRQNIHEDNISETVTINTSSGESLSIPVLIHGFPEKKMRINANVYDADYDYIHDKLALACYENGNSYIGIYDLASATFSKIPIDNGNPGIISFADDGSYLAATQNYDDQIYSINHLENKVNSSIVLSSSISDLVSAAGKIAYTFHYDSYNGSEMSILNFSTGDQNSCDLDGYLSIRDAHLYPSGNYIYGVDDYSYLIKINISNADPILVYSHYVSDLEGKIWLSRDGSRIFTDEKRILEINPQLTGYDVTEEADLNISKSYIQGIEQDIIHNEYYIIPSNNYSFNNDSESQVVLVFNSSFEQTKSIPLEDYYVSSYSEPYYYLVDPSAEYVFMSSDGNKIIIVSKATNTSNNWGIEILDR